MSPLSSGIVLFLATTRSTVSTSRASGGTCSPSAVGTTVTHSAGKFYFEVMCGPEEPGGFYGSIGLAPPDMPVEGYVGGTPSITFQCYQDAYVNDDYTPAPYGLNAYWAGDVVGVAVDFDARLIWFRVQQRAVEQPGSAG